MIARIFIPLVVCLVLSDLWIDHRYIHPLARRYAHPLRLLWWLQCMACLVFTVGMASIRGFAPHDMRWLNAYLLLLGVWIVPKAWLALCTFVETRLSRCKRPSLPWGMMTGMALGAFTWWIVAWGTTMGLRQLKVRHVTLYFADLPAAFDGYRICQLSDLHVGTFSYVNRQFPRRVVDSIMAQRCDAIVFTGDLQNIEPREIEPFHKLLGTLQAPDGLYSVRGNHDYDVYQKDAGEALKQHNKQLLCDMERDMDWRLLCNEHVTLRRDSDSLVIAGEENDGKPPFPQYADLQQTLRGVDTDAFTVLMQHDPSAWRRDILPNSHVQLTLSGHTHGGQVSVLGLRLTRLAGEDCGLYIEGGRMLYVDSGAGAFVPLRFGVPPQITIITLKRR